MWASQGNFHGGFSRAVDITMWPNVQRLIERNVKCHATFFRLIKFKISIWVWWVCNNTFADGNEEVTIVRNIFCPFSEIASRHVFNELILGSFWLNAEVDWACKINTDIYTTRLYFYMFSFTLFAFLSKPVIYIDGFQFYIVVSEFVSMYIDGFQFYIVVS